MSAVALCLLLAWPAGLLAAGILDLARFQIPNRLTLALAAVAGCGVLAGALSGQLDGTAALTHLTTALITLGVGILIFAMGWIGGGDIKLLAAIALWSGPSDFPQLLIAATLAGGVFSLLILLFRQFPLPGPMARTGFIARLHQQGEGVPYGVPIVLVSLGLFPGSVLGVMLRTFLSA